MSEEWPETDETIWIESVTNPNAEPVCKLTWGRYSSFPPVEDVRAAALDILTCAAYAEMMMTLVGKVGIPASTVAGFTTSLLADSDREMFGTHSTLEFTPAGSSARQEPYVLVRTPEDAKATAKGVLTAREARDMASAWFAAAEGTESDQIINRALDTMPEAVVDRHLLFDLMRGMRQT